MTDRNETLDQALARNVRDALMEDIGRGDWTAQLVPAGRRVHRPACRPRSGRDLRPALVRRLRAGAGPDGATDWGGRGRPSRRPDRVATSRPMPRPAVAERPAAELPADALGRGHRHAALCRAIEGCRPTRAAAWCWTRARPCRACARRRSTRCAWAAGSNQRMALWDGILIKENHIAAAGGIAQALQRGAALNAGVTLQIEVESLEELRRPWQPAPQRAAGRLFAWPTCTPPMR
jgi:nicotinate-nucleotide pyrophosphorylase (carboxylating)